jgi:hypothetical protein
MKTIYELLQIQRPDGITSECVKATLPDGRELFIPLDPANSDYQAYLAQLEEEAN